MGIASIVFSNCICHAHDEHFDLNDKLFVAMNYKQTHCAHGETRSLFIIQKSIFQ